MVFMCTLQRSVANLKNCRVNTRLMIFITVAMLKSKFLVMYTWEISNSCWSMIFMISIISATTLAVRVAYDIVQNDVALRYSSILIECEISYIFRRQSDVEGCVSV